MIYLVTSQNRLDYNGHITHISAQQAITILKTSPVLQLDCETTGLNFIDDSLLLVQVGNATDQVIFDVRSTMYPELKALLTDGRMKLLHNAVFDYKFLKKAGIVLDKVWDTMLIEKLLHNGEIVPKGFYKLSGVIQRYTSHEISKAQQTSFIGFNDTEFTHDQLLYAAADVQYLEQVRAGQIAHLKQSDLLHCAKLENAACLAFGDIEYNGMAVDTDNWAALAQMQVLKADMYGAMLSGIVLREELFAEFAPQAYQTSLFRSDAQALTDCITINWSSPSQVLPILQKIIPELESCDTKYLSAAHRADHDLIDGYISYRESSKLATAFGEEWLNKYVCSDGKVHTRFQQILRTGRVSSASPNMQQIPSNNEYRNCFICPEGWSYVSSDFSSQELCIIAFGSQDPVWLAALQRGEDLHSVCADLVYGDEWHAAARPGCEFQATKEKCNCPEHKRLRTAVKSINFGLAYGMGPNKLSDQLQISIKEAEKLIAQYFKVFPSIKKYLDDSASLGKKRGYIRTMEPYKRIRYFPEWKGRATKKVDMGKIDRMSRNTPIQGTAGDMTKEAMIRCRQEFLDDPDIQMVMVVHDQIDFIVKSSRIDYYSERITVHMEAAGKSIITNGLLKADTTTANAWEK